MGRDRAPGSRRPPRVGVAGSDATVSAARTNVGRCRRGGPSYQPSWVRRAVNPLVAERVVMVWARRVVGWSFDARSLPHECRGLAEGLAAIS